MEYWPAERSGKDTVLDSSFPLSPSSSSWKLDGLRPPVVVKAKSWGPSGRVSRLSVMLPRLRFVNVQVTSSDGLRSMFDGGDPSEQVAVVSHPGTESSETEYPEPAGTSANRRLRASAVGIVPVVVELEARGAEAAAGGEGEVLRVVGLGVLDHHDSGAAGVREGAGDGLLGSDVDVRRRRAVGARRSGLLPARRNRLRDRVSRPGRHGLERAGAARPFVSLPSSSSSKDDGLSPPAAVKPKSCGSLGWRP